MNKCLTQEQRDLFIDIYDELVHKSELTDSQIEIIMRITKILEM